MTISKNPRALAYAVGILVIAGGLLYSFESHRSAQTPAADNPAMASDAALIATTTATSTAMAATTDAAPTHIARGASIPAPTPKTYSNPELGFAITIPSNYSVFETSSGVSIGAPATNTQPAMDITVSPSPCDMAGKPVTNPTDYVKKTYGLTPKMTFDASGSNAVIVDRPRVFSLDDPSANKGPGYPVYSSNIVGYKNFREMYIIRNCSMYEASYYVGDASFFDDAVTTFSFPPSDPGIPETQAPAFKAQ